MGGPQRLAERAGPARARELIFTGERYQADVLERWNVVNRVLPDEGFAEAARAYAHRWPPARRSPTRRPRAGLRVGARRCPAPTRWSGGVRIALRHRDLRGAVASFLPTAGKGHLPGRRPGTGEAAIGKLRTRVDWARSARLQKKS